MPAHAGPKESLSVPDDLTLSEVEEMDFAARAAVMGVSVAELKAHILASYLSRIDAEVVALCANERRARRRLH